MININRPKDCCGCSACASICSHNAITMKPDALGFLYPTVDAEKCVDCGLCEKVCSFNDSYDTSLNFPVPIAYGARHKDIGEVMQSRSGAVFVALSDYILENGGVVYGAGFADHFRVVHKRAVTKEERNEFRGSKYVQSDMNSVFRQVKKDLKDGMTVLFSGTPCQTAGLHSYIGNKLRENLILNDLVCHGVPSPYIWRDYIAYLEKEVGSTIIGVNFRDKVQYGWKAHRESFIFDHNVSCDARVEGQWYTKNFSNNIMFRHSCGKCHFCNTRRPSDITIADFWGWQKQDANINSDDKGLNLVLVNTPKGQTLFEKIIDNLYVISASPTAYLQPNLKAPTQIHRKRLRFERDYVRKGFSYVLRHEYHNQPFWKRFLKELLFFRNSK